MHKQPKQRERSFKVFHMEFNQLRDTTPLDFHLPMPVPVPRHPCVRVSPRMLSITSDERNCPFLMFTISIPSASHHHFVRIACMPPQPQSHAQRRHSLIRNDLAPSDPAHYRRILSLPELDSAPCPAHDASAASWCICCVMRQHEA